MKTQIPTQAEPVKNSLPFGRNQYKHEASGVLLYKEIAQPQAVTFAEVFQDFAPYPITLGNGGKMPKHAFEPRFITGQNIAANLFDNVREIMHGRASREHPDERMAVGPFCSLSRTKQGGYLDVRCADWVLSRIQERTIIIGNDRMSFEIVDHENGWSLVTANHSCILGSVWLAYIKTDSIPKCQGQA